MERGLFIAVIASFCFASIIKTQPKEEGEDVMYRRSSLHTILMESENFPRKDIILNAYYNAPFPDKYNEHTIGAKSFDPKKYVISNEERELYGKKQTKAGNFIKNLATLSNDGVVNYEAIDNPLIIDKYFKENKIANQLVAKWFNRQEDGSFNTDLIASRGVFDASFLSSKTAQASSDGRALLMTAGLELIDNTFVVVSKMNFVSNEAAAAVIRDVAKEKAATIKIPILQSAALTAADIAYNKAKEGYTVLTTSFLYKLVWNDTIQNIFFTNLYMDKNNLDEKKKLAFDNSDLFELEFVGDENSSSLVLFSLIEKRTEEQILTMATTRNIDAVYAKLQKKYDIFKTKTPLYTGNPITAKIGMKEGLEGGEKFEVLEQRIDPKTGIAEYKSIGKITVDKKLIWDNRFNLGDESIADDGESKTVLDRTTFKGSDKYYSGLLIKQIK